MSQLNVVIRPFEGERKFAANEIVDIDGWRLARHLTEHRYIRPATAAEIAAAGSVPVKRGRPAHGE